jgi:protein-tyrosine phosphatase
MAHDSTGYGPDDDFADPYGRGPEAARHAVLEIAGLLQEILPGLGALPTTHRVLAS